MAGPPFGEHSGGRIPKRSTGADCKSAGLRLHRFESCSYHHFLFFPAKTLLVNGNTMASIVSGTASSQNPIEVQPSMSMFQAAAIDGMIHEGDEPAAAKNITERDTEQVAKRFKDPDSER